MDAPGRVTNSASRLNLPRPLRTDPQQVFFNHSVNSPVNPGRQAASPVLWGGSRTRCPKRLRRYAAMLATCFVLTVVGVPGQLSAQTVEDTDTRPNILVFVSDDMGWGQPGFNGGTEVETPNMDRLADEGVKLTQFYVQPVCAPTRASLLTGRYAWKTGMAGNPDDRKDDGLLLDERTIAEALRDSSYATWLVGKWHAGHWGSERLPLQRGFDHHYGFYDGFIDSYKLVRPWRGWHEILDWHRNGRPVVESGYSTFLLAEEASQLIERHDGSRPFFLYVAFNAPHDPYQAPPEYIAQFSHLPYDLETRKQRAMVKAMDDAIGQVMDALERRGVLEETLVMFLNDNGGESEAGGNSPYRGLKRSYLEGGIRVPAVMRWPSRITAGSASDALMHVADLFPTFAGLAGADTGGGLPLDGLDVWEAIANGAESPREEVVHSLDVIRVGDWKLLEEDGEFANGKSSPLQLYNIAEDPYETTNLASSETARVAALRERLVYHRPFARDAEPGAPIPGLDRIDSTDDRLVMFGEEENTAFGTAIQPALTQREAGNLGPALLRLEASGTSLKLIYNETLDAAAVPHADAFTVVVNPGYRAAEVVGVELSGSEVVLTLAEAVADGNTVGLTYEVLDTGAIQDTDSLEAVGITWVTATVSITDDDFTVSFEQASYFVAEGDSVAIKVSLSAGQQDSLTIPLTTTNQDGASNSDYSDVPNPTIIAGDTEASFTFSATQDTIDDDGEKVKLGFGALPTGLTASGTTEATVSITDDDASPVITTNTASPILAEENETAVATLAATDADRPVQDLTWQITAGADQNRFRLTVDGVLTFGVAQDYEAPGDSDRDGDYEVTVEVSDGANPVEAMFTIRLEDVDDTAPMLSSASVTGTTLTLTYDEALDGSSTPVPGDFTVSGGDRVRAVTAVRVNGSAVELTLDVGGEHEEAGIQVSYTPGANPIQDVLGNDAEALSREAVTNETPDTTSPTVSSVEIPSTPPDNRDTYAIGDVIEATVTFDETVVVTRTPRMRLRVGSRNRTAGYLRGSGAAALVFGYEVALGDEDTDGVSIAAGRIGRRGGTIKDEADNDAVLDHEAVAPQAGHKVDGVRPAFLSAVVDGSSLTLTYGEALDGGSRPGTGDFTVEVGGTGRSVSAVSVSGSVVTLTLDPAVEHGDTGIRVNYSPGTRPIRDAVGNDALALSNRSVTNTTGAPPSVTLQLMPTSISENGGSATVTARLSHTSGETTTVTVSATAVSPAVSGDFTLSMNKTLMIEAAQAASTGTVTITANNNGVDAPNKTVMVMGTATNSEGVTGPSDETLTITDDDATPVITTAALIPVAENETVVATLLATDEDDRTEDLVWDITGGNDQSQFTLTRGGELAFTAAKDYEEPDDSDRDRDYEVTVQVSDGANAVEADFTVRLQDVDDTAPTVSGIRISSNPGTDRTYAAGDEIRVTVTFSETVEVTGAPQLSLELGGGRRTATYEGGSGTAALVFAYEVAGGESDTDGVGVEAGSLSGGTIRDEARNNAELDHDGLAADSGHKVDAVKPQLAATGGVVVDGAALTLTYGELLDGSSTLAASDFTVSGGDLARTVSNAAVSGSAVALTLDPAVEHGETGVTVSYTPGTNPIRDVAGNEAEALSRVPVNNETPDTTAPGVISLAISSNPGSDQAYAAEDVIEVTVSFSETVEVTGTPQVRLRVGSSNRTADYLRGTDTEELVFAYEVADGDEDTDGVSIEAGRIALNGGTIEDEADNPAELAHEAVAAQVGHKVDGVRPVFVSAAVDGSSLTLTYGETLDGGSRPAPGDFTVEVDGAGRSVTGVSVSGSVVTLTLSTAVEHGDTGIRVSYTPGTNPIQDAVGNDARGLSNQAVTNTTGAPNTAPEITTVGPFTVRENQALVRRLAARDDDSGDEVTGWSIMGGADQSQFSITSDTGVLSFQEAPDYESPTDVVSGDPPSGAGDNEYVVTVEVRSGAGARELEAEQTFTVRVTDEREPPGIPEAPAFSGETADSLTVHWRDPENTGPAITDYDVRYREKGPGRFIDAQHMGPGLSLTLDDLEPGTAYEVQVRATNDEGTSDWSESGEGMTVTPLTVEMMGGTEPPVEGPFTVRFSFSEPVRGFTQAAIETAQDPACTDEQNNPVFCEPDIGRLETVDDRVFSTTVTPQTDRVAHNYTLTLTVSGGAVRSSVGNKLNEEAMLGGRVAPPGVTVPISEIGLRASGLDRAGRLNWNRPTNDGGSPIIRYEHRHAPVGEVWNDWENVGARATGVTVGNLVNGLEYVFEVRAINALGKGPVETAAATPVLRTDPPPPPPPPGPRQTVPDAPRNLLADATDGAVTLMWEVPEDDGGAVITDYEYRIDRRNPWISIGSTDTTHTVASLVNGTTYVFQVRALNRIGRSGPSLPAEATPIAQVVLDLAHFANGAGIISEVVLANVAPHPIRPALYFYDQEGEPIAAESMVDVLGDLGIQEDGGLTIRTEMEPLGELTISTHGRGDLVSGSVKVAAYGAIGGVLRFDLPGIGVAGVGASQPVRDAIFPARRQAGGISTGAAIHNLGEEALVVGCQLMKDGAVLEEEEISLEANGQEARYIEEMFTSTDTSDFVGSVRCTAPEGEGMFTGVAVELDASNQIFTTLPVVPVPERMSQE